MTLKTFLTDALASAVELGVATPDDVLRFATPELLAEHLPRPLWARLLTACLGAARVDAQLIVETVGVPNLCEHLPASVIWQCVASVAARELDAPISSAPPPMRIGVTPMATIGSSGSSASAPATAAGSGGWAARPSTAAPLPLAPPPAPTPVADVRTGSKPNQAPPQMPIPAPQPSLDVLDVLEELDDPLASPPPPVAPQGRARGTTRQPFRNSSTSSGGAAGRAAASANAHTARRPQAQAAPAPTPRRAPTEVNDYDIATDVRSAEDFSAGDDLVDWSSSEETVTGDDRDLRKR
jgi:hypothetical protein|nr:hypothetical protein [Kofleriaceae bacterium]